MTEPKSAPAAPAPDALTSEPRWPAVLALLATAGLNLLLPTDLRFGPSWLMVAIISLLLIPTVVAHRVGKNELNHVLSHSALSIVTASLVWSLALLMSRLPAHKDSPQVLLRVAVIMWMANVLIFASWYWRLDGGGPNARDLRPSHSDGAFLFPQMAAGQRARNWRPGFVDYLFLAFNTSTAFSPTDVPVLSRWAKVMMMLQALISLGTVAIVAARAVNIL